MFNLFKIYLLEIYNSWKTNWGWIAVPLFIVEMVSLFEPVWYERHLPKVYALMTTQGWIILWLLVFYFLMVRHSIKKETKSPDPLNQMATALEKLAKAQEATRPEKNISFYIKKLGKLERFKKFIQIKIKQGDKLFRSNLEDKLTRRLPPPKEEESFNEGMADGVLIEEGPMDASQIEDFNRCYKDWKFQVHRGFANAFSFSERPAFNDPGIGATHVIYGNSRESLEKEIEILKEVEKNVKTDWFRDGFKPELLKEYEDLDCDPKQGEEKTRLDLWFEFLDLKICQGKKYYSDPLFTHNKFIEYFEQIHEGLKTAIEDKTKFYPWLNSIGWEHLRIKEGGIREDLRHLQSLLKVLLDCLSEFRTKKPTNDIDLRKEFNPADLKKYEGEKCS